MKSSARRRLGVGALVAIILTGGAYAQAGIINSVVLQPRIFNDVPGATFVGVNNYPVLISLSEQGVSAPTGFANMDDWLFSSDGGISANLFGNNDLFSVSMTLTLTGTPTSPRKEAGFRLNSSIGGDGLFIVNTDAHEIVAFGGALPFYSFGNTYNSGDTITLGMTYLVDNNNKHAIVYTANGINSPALEFSDLEQGVIPGSTLGGYLQVVNDPNNPNNGGTAVFQNISFVSAPATGAVPEPLTMTSAFLALAALGAAFLRGRKGAIQN